MCSVLEHAFKFVSLNTRLQFKTLAPFLCSFPPVQTDPEPLYEDKKIQIRYSFVKFNVRARSIFLQ